VVPHVARSQPFFSSRCSAGYNDPVSNLKHVLRPAANSQRNGIAVHRSPSQRLQNQHIECALEQLDPVLVRFMGGHIRMETFYTHGGRISIAFRWNLTASLFRPLRSSKRSPGRHKAAGYAIGSHRACTPRRKILTVRHL
jgi:hypothetical protein